MAAKTKLSKSMTLTQFENGYWYQTELKAFAATIGIPGAGKLRKDELEKAIGVFLQSGKIQAPTQRSLTKTGDKDLAKGLSLTLPIVNYTSNKTTKTFIITEAQKMAPGLKAKSGVWYRLNRWREDQLTQGTVITYGDLVQQYIKLNQAAAPFAKIPQTRYINFLSEFLAHEANATHAAAVRAWKKLKAMDAPKSYAAWVKYRAKRA